MKSQEERLGERTKTEWKKKGKEISEWKRQRKDEKERRE